MLASIELDDEPTLETSEVGDEGTNWKLTAKTKSKSAATQVVPEKSLCFRGMLA
jgi:hypothetical protein